MNQIPPHIQKQIEAEAEKFEVTRGSYSYPDFKAGAQALHEIYAKSAGEFEIEKAREMLSRARQKLMEQNKPDSFMVIDALLNELDAVIEVEKISSLLAARDSEIAGLRAELNKWKALYSTYEQTQNAMALDFTIKTKG